MYNTIFFCIISFLVLDFVIEQWLARLNASYFGKVLPASLQGIYDNDKYDKQQRYSWVNYKFSLITSTFSLLVLLTAFSLGVFGWLDQLLRIYINSELLISLAFFGVIYVTNDLLGLPFDYYQTFVIEDKFEFNKSTKVLFFTDKIKSILLTIVVGGLLLGAIVYLYQLSPEYFWFGAWVLISLFTVLMLMFYSEWIVPLFNKQTPLEEGELRSSIEDFAAKAGFQLTNIYVMDGSKRSTKANAYFSGLGSKKRIVLFDTLIKELSSEEITAVLAHEIGHYKHKHSLQMLFLSLLNTLFMFGLLGYFLASPDLSQAMGSQQPSFHLGLLAFGVLYSPVSLLLGLALNYLSRKNEYQADKYAADLGLADPLVKALKKLSSSSLANLQPHPAYVFMYFSHPSLLQRMEALKSC